MIRKTLTLMILLSLALLLPVTARASDESDPFAELLFAPELIMEHQAAIGLSSSQRRTLMTEITQAQADFVPFQMEMAEVGERLKNLLAEPRVDEAAALEAAAEIMALEGRIKTRHLVLAIRLKNLLSEDQQAELARRR